MNLRRFNEISVWRDKDNPHSSRIRVGQFTVLVHHYIGYPPETWFASCDRLFSRVKLSTTTLEDSKYKAISMLQDHLDEAIRDIDNIKW